MANEEEKHEVHTLGELLRQNRIAKGLDIEALAEETRISIINLRAMEEDDFASLPPVTFARGLYTIYAKVLELDVDEVLKKFSEENSTAEQKNKPKPTPSRLAREIGSMAERPPAPPTSLFGIVFIIFVILIALGCWYYSINPASYVSEKLRGLQQEESSEPATPAEEPLEETAEESRASLMPAEDTSISPQAVANNQQTKYVLEAYFPDFTVIEISVDDSRKQEISVTAGRKMTWTAEQAIELFLPEETTVQLNLNGSSLTLPDSENGRIGLFIPEFLFE